MNIYIKNRELFQIVLFCCIGGASTILNYSIFFLLFFMNINYISASAVGFTCGVLFSYPLNSKYTFNQKENINKKRIIQYFTVYSMSLIFCLIFLKITVIIGVPILIANIFTIFFGTIINYIGIKTMIFEVEKSKKMIRYLIFRYRFLMRYIIIGLFSIIIEVSIIYALDLLIDYNQTFNYFYILIGFGTGVLIAWYLNTRLNFPVTKEQNAHVFKFYIGISIFSFVLNILLMMMLASYKLFQSYEFARFFTAGSIFLISYSLHRHLTFNYIKKVGVAIYALPTEDIVTIRSKVSSYADFIHIDLIDQTFNPNASLPDIEVCKNIFNEWPYTPKMIHIMSRYPKQWVLKTYPYTDNIIIHCEIDESIDEVIDLISSLNKKPGLSLFFNTDIEIIQPYLGKVNIIQVLGISKPGCSGQDLNISALDMTQKLSGLKRNFGFEICFDGGVKVSNVSHIPADYVVSASGILNAKDPVTAILNLKTNSCYYSSIHDDLRTFLLKEINLTVISIDHIKAGNLVGSFQRGNGIDGISDIDIVLIVDKLEKSKFDTIIEKFSLLAERVRSNFGYRVIINSSFGPLKFNEEKTIVFHVMVYDCEGHRNHCLKSPFTCMDWQLSNVFFHQSMDAIFVVKRLMPCDFFNSRRGIQDYISDVSRGSISYREYDFQGINPIEIKKEKPMDNKDRFDFSYHIMKFCIKNYLKLHYSENLDLPFNESQERFFSIFPKNQYNYSQYFEKVQKNKEKNSYPIWSNSDFEIINKFLIDFQAQFEQIFIKRSLHLFFIRHLPTNINLERIFQGSQTDLSIIYPSVEERERISNFCLQIYLDKIYSSPMKRTQETASIYKEFNPFHQYIIDDRLTEINYGLLDGCSFDDIENRFPYLIISWKNNEDVKFPKGESHADVVNRIQLFLKQIMLEWNGNPKNYAIFTHNVVIRCLIGSWLDLPQHVWHKIIIPYNTPIECVVTHEKNFYLNISVELRELLLKDIRAGYL